MRQKILIVEDDHALRDVLRRGLYDEGFAPVLAADGATALRLAATADIAAAVLDVGLPDSDGRDVCQAMRANGFLAPVIFLTARHQLTDRLSGFSAGGDDYLPKPFHLAELAARLRVALRRAVPAAATAGDLVLDAVGHSVTVHGARVALTPTEFRLLATLVAAGGSTVPRRELVRAGWPEGAHVSDNTLDQYLTRLRRKLREAGSTLKIGTARGIGHHLS
ncbi:DNA-binding response regulator [Streptomyces glebosus]|uniref:DNA-binding response regulator n=1 Tax=Streptomyces glebosus TaxID=249580 RepID=A0A640SPD9_9ACTN|nr:response regulator transcription factor [Streptomyces glebosus]GFE13279.1 DNA-binding response regulator [Streptomyces glebosus]GHG66669.1 DNA-binding response regulator [Streptomyces glebosus]